MCGTWDAGALGAAAARNWAGWTSEEETIHLGSGLRADSVAGGRVASKFGDAPGSVEPVNSCRWTR